MEGLGNDIDNPIVLDEEEDVIFERRSKWYVNDMGIFRYADAEDGPADNGSVDVWVLSGNEDYSSSDSGNTIVSLMICNCILIYDIRL